MTATTDRWLQDRTHWVFDLDGTLTLPMHDFEAIRRSLGIPSGADILAHLAALPDAEARAKHAWLFEHERGLAESAQVAPGAVELVLDLHGRGRTLGILTRNSRKLAWTTLAAIGLSHVFGESHVLGREDAAPKPSPEGLYRLATMWNVSPTELVMVGDFRFDLECGRAAGAATVLVNLEENPWPELADAFAPTCGILRTWL